MFTKPFLRGFLLFIGCIILLACSTHGALTAVAKGIEVAACVAENQDQPKTILYAKCLTDNVTPEDIDHMLASQRLATSRYMTQRGFHGSESSDAGSDAH